MKPLWTRFLLLVVAGATLVVAGWFLVAQGESANISLEGISKEDLAEKDFILLPLDPGQLAKISRQAAEETVAGHFPNIAVRQAILVRLVEPERGLDAAAWAINLDPEDKDIRYSIPGSTTVWLVAFVDANTGAFIQGSHRFKSPTDGRPLSGGGLGPEYYSTPVPPPPLSAPASQ